MRTRCRAATRAIAGLRALLIIFGVAAIIVGAGAVSVDAATTGGIRIVQVQGLLDPPNVELVERAIHEANADDASLVIIQLDSPGATGTDVDPATRAIRESEVPVAVWIGPTGSEARGAAAMIYAAAHAGAVAPGSSLGPAAPERLDTPDDPSAHETRQELTVAGNDRGWSADATRALTEENLSARAATDLGLSKVDAPTVGEFLVSLDEVVVETQAGAIELDTARVVGEGNDRRREPNQDVRFVSLQIGPRLEHILTTPAIAYLLFAVGGALLLFEFFTISIAVAGGVGALALIGACVGFANLPVHWWAFGLIVAGIVGFGVDVQVQRLGFWSAAGAAMFIIGSVFLYGGSSRLDPPWWVWVLVIVSMIVFMIGGMTSVVRSRFSTPTVGREDLVGETGTVEVDVAPDGVVELRGARWRAQTNRATPIPRGNSVRVVAVEGVVLEVEPAEPI